MDTFESRHCESFDLTAGIRITDSHVNFLILFHLVAYFIYNLLFSTANAKPRGLLTHTFSKDQSNKSTSTESYS